LITDQEYVEEEWTFKPFDAPELEAENDDDEDESSDDRPA